MGVVGPWLQFDNGSLSYRGSSVSLSQTMSSTFFSKCGVSVSLEANPNKMFMSIILGDIPKIIGWTVILIKDLFLGRESGQSGMTKKGWVISLSLK